MSTLTPLRDFSDAISPMVVKELRHGLRTRFFTAALISFHALLLCILASGLAGVDGETLNGIFWFTTLVSLLGVLPFRGFAALTSENDGGTLDMLTLTSITS